MDCIHTHTHTDVLWKTDTYFRWMITLSHSLYIKRIKLCIIIFALVLHAVLLCVVTSSQVVYVVLTMGRRWIMIVMMILLITIYTNDFYFHHLLIELHSLVKYCCPYLFFCWIKRWDVGEICSRNAITLYLWCTCIEYNNSAHSHIYMIYIITTIIIMYTLTVNCTVK